VPSCEGFGSEGLLDCTFSWIFGFPPQVHGHPAILEHMFDSLSAHERELLDSITSAQVAENAAAARKAEAVREFALARAASLTSVGDVEPERVERKIVAEVAVACRVSPFHGCRRLHLARDLHLGLDHVRGLFAAGKLEPLRRTVRAGARPRRPRHASTRPPAGPRAGHAPAAENPATAVGPRGQRRTTASGGNGAGQPRAVSVPGSAAGPGAVSNRTHPSRSASSG
jgi:hypothetical protein